MARNFEIVIVGAYSGGAEILEMLAMANFKGKVALVRDVGQGRDVPINIKSSAHKTRARSIKRNAKRLVLSYFEEAPIHPIESKTGTLRLESGEILNFRKVLICDPMGSR